MVAARVAAMTQIPEQPSTTTTSPAARDGARYGMSLVATLFGAYLLINGSYTQFVSVVLLGHQAELAPLLLSQFLFSVIVLVFGALVAPASIARRVVAAAIEIVAILIFAVFQPVYLSGGGPNLGRAGIWFSGGFLTPVFLVTLAAAAAWLVLRARPGWTPLFLLATLIIPFVSVGLVFAGVGSTTTPMILNTLCTVIGVGIAWLARAVAGSRAQPIA
jgi:hypothetical protein